MIKHKWLWAIGTACLLLFVFVLNISSPQFSYNVFKSTGGWGYNILYRKRIVIHQDVIPALGEGIAFPDKESAQKAAQLIITKLKENKSPTLTMFEMKDILHQNQ